MARTPLSARRLNSWLKPGLRLEALEDRAVPAVLVVDPTPDPGEFATIQAAITAANPTDADGIDTILIDPGTYAESVTVDRAVILDGNGATAADVIIDPTSGAGITISANNVTVRDLRVTGATTGIATSGSVTGLNLTNVQADTNTGAGVNLSNVGGTVTLSGLTLTGNGAANTLTPAAGATVNFTATTGSTPVTVTATGTSLQVSGSQAITLPGGVAFNLNLTGGSGADTFNVTPAATGGATITVNGGQPTGASGDVLDLNLTGLTGTAVTNLTSSANGLSGTFTFGNAASVSFSGVESLADVAVITGRVFNDANNNDVQDAGETGVGGVTVFLDADGDGVLDAGEVSATTDAQGNYALASLTGGTTRVRAVLPAGAEQTTTNPADVSTSLGTVTSGGNIGIRFPGGGTPGTSTVTGVAFNDRDNDGVRDNNEIGVNGLVVYLDLDNDGKLDRDEPSDLTETVNGVAGSFTLTSDVVGVQARVRVVEKPGFLENTNEPQVTLSAGGTQTVNVGVRADLPAHATPARRFAVGVVHGNAAKIRVFDGDGKPEFEIPAGTGDVRVATGDVNGDGVDDIIFVSGPGRQTTLVVVDGATRQEILRINPFETFTGGGFVTIGDVNQDGINDIIVTPDESGGPRVVVVRGGDLQTILSFFGIDDANFRGGARAGVADLNGDGRPDLIVAAGTGGGPRVALFDGVALNRGQFRKLMNDFFVFEDVLRNGVFVTGADVNNDGVDDLIVGAGPGGGPRVLILDGQILQTQGIAAALASPLASFFGGDPSNRGGIRPVAKDLDRDGKPEILTGGGHGKRVTAYNGEDFSKEFEFDTDSDDFGSRNGVFVG